ncbi:hypothetical protein BWI15_19295 [Kribbella sp. ALI-6-A]|uniref:hypothetical protein n=1 Tax=Kribbella sp. ALI-6-A TaxID=1933817 RepID=UPI00097C2B43|nr:hypothetical protein [Kribbella sp. ALI-6-A]ONI72213.1 hypothetical protein BWI15_19295 [Kribbella sp. ALI-6-A]
MRPRLAATIVLALTVALTGCGANDDWAGPRVAPSPVGALGNGFVDPKAPPTPEATVTPKPGSWDGVHPSKGYRVVLLSAGGDAQTKTLTDAVTSWAKAEKVDLKTITADDPAHRIDRITDALGLRPDLIVAAGNSLIDPLALVTANHLDQQFLVVGAELAEPTHNVTAADWTGAAYRGEGLGMSSTYDPASFTPERAGAAIRAGVASVLHGLTGIVVWIG